jgi:hypothetical protein
MTVFDEELKAAWAKLPKEKQDDLWRRYCERAAKVPDQDGRGAEKAATQARRTPTAWPRAGTCPTSSNRPPAWTA